MIFFFAQTSATGLSLSIIIVVVVVALLCLLLVVGGIAYVFQAKKSKFLSLANCFFDLIFFFQDSTTLNDVQMSPVDTSMEQDHDVARHYSTIATK